MSAIDQLLVTIINLMADKVFFSPTIVCLRGTPFGRGIVSEPLGEPLREKTEGKNYSVYSGLKAHLER